MRRALSLAAGALAFMAMTTFAWAQTTEPTPTTAAPTTTGVIMTLPPKTSTTGAPATTTTPTTAKTGTGKPVPPPASGASQPLDPSLLGGTIIPTETATTLFGTEVVTIPTTTPPTTAAEVTALRVSESSDGASGATLGLAAVAWLASLGGLLVYAEDQRGKRWRHLAR